MELTQAASAHRSIDAEIGERVHQLIWRERISQAAFAGNLGISQSTMSKKLRGERPWYAPELKTAASALGVTVGYLFGEDDGGDVGPAGIEPTTSTVFAGELIAFPRARTARSAGYLAAS